jgi:hypothetical protein
MTDRAAQLRAGAARSRHAKRKAGLRPHEHWYRDDEAPAVAEFFWNLADKRQETNDENIPALPLANLPMVAGS